MKEITEQPREGLLPMNSDGTLRLKADRSDILEGALFSYVHYFVRGDVSADGAHAVSLCDQVEYGDVHSLRWNKKYKHCRKCETVEAQTARKAAK